MEFLIFNFDRTCYTNSIVFVCSCPWNGRENCCHFSYTVASFMDCKRRFKGNRLTSSSLIYFYFTGEMWCIYFHEQNSFPMKSRGGTISLISIKIYSCPTAGTKRLNWISLVTETKFTELLIHILLKNYNIYNLLHSSTNASNNGSTV